MSAWTRWIVVVVAAIIGLSSCTDPHSALRARLENFPAPPDLVLFHEEERGPSSCVNGDCPSVTRYFLTEQPLDVTCRTVRRAVDGWVSERTSEPVEWNMERDAFNACSGGIRGLAVSVFEADQLPVLTLNDIDPSQLRGYRSAVLISVIGL